MIQAIMKGRQRQSEEERSCRAYDNILIATGAAVS